MSTSPTIMVNICCCISALTYTELTEMTYIQHVNSVTTQDINMVKDDSIDPMIGMEVAGYRPGGFRAGNSSRS